MSDFTEAELEAFLDEMLDPDRASLVENAAREDSDLRERLARIHQRRDAGIHTLGEIWRRFELGVPSREELGSYLLGVLEDEKRDYIDFRINFLKCQVTLANLEDLKNEQEANDKAVADRRSRYLQSSAGFFEDDESDVD